MPSFWLDGYDDNAGTRKRREAERQVRAKFPALLEGSSGWHRAVDNRVARIRFA